MTEKLILVSWHISSIVITSNLVQLCEFKQELSNFLKDSFRPFPLTGSFFSRSIENGILATTKKKNFS